MKVLLALAAIAGALVVVAVVGARSAAPTSSVPPASASVPPLAVPSQARTPSPPTRGRAVVYVSAPSAPPLALDDPKGVEGDTSSARVYYRLQHLWSFTGPVPPGYVPIASAVKARPYRVGLADDLAVVTFLVPADGWGIDPSHVKMLLQQIVFTVTEEPGVERVRLRQEGTATSLDPEEGPPLIIAGTRVPLILTRENVLR